MILKKSNPIFLIGNSFSLSLIRRDVKIEVSHLNELKRLGQTAECHSLWGHFNTLKMANDLLGFDVSPREDRIAVRLNDDDYPTLSDEYFTECWVLSPDYKKGFRPEIGEEVSPDMIITWQVLRMIWK